MLDSVSLGCLILFVVATLWVTEWIHVSLTALLIPVLAILSGIFDVNEAFKSFANPIIFIFLGGFALSAALHRQQLDRRIAQTIIRLARGQLSRAATLIFMTTAMLSMWVSNTATAAMMLPLTLGVLSSLDYSEHRQTYLYFLLGVAFSANIGGIGTLVGSPPNAIAAAAVGLNFTQWMMYAIPVVLVLMPIMVYTLRFCFKPDLRAQVEFEQSAPSPLNSAQKLTLLVFALTVLGWVFSQQIGLWLGIKGSVDALVAVSAIVLLGSMKLLTWQTFDQQTDWGILLLFGGGLTLSALLSSSGASAFMAEQIIQLITEMPLILFVLGMVVFIMVLTAVASNTASAALLLPIFLPLAEGLGVSQIGLALLIAVGASCAFTLPVATPPNAIVFGSGFVPQREMLRVGSILSVVILPVLMGLGFN
ncbi:solute carrier family 13 (sodium-dependent dicarboxylate transporter), member 2/3/5 [Oceanospirillum multiglobuliferum]|uniref:Anion transporter n=1 Tax=Oceanospirillum multiglobuliferum TaxID=64969 RepID=A0A1T4S6Z5_9GAMM|nr:DASS family sodium-coupled anion symporter [Oceanospirillum multiglobuliferum]OPX54414.1 Anion transporter [Oceanospirillum multiglobuliferum]SKA24090.1 solute carrier family 13 (sodium-dependent dicarboxylate transporter), member 2/3/5 [Oceanospirillum multiglobuliferum]